VPELQAPGRAAPAPSAAASILRRFAPPHVARTYGEDFSVQPYKGDFDGECIWICDRVKGCFHQCDPGGGLIARRGKPGPGPGEIGRPISIRVAPDGSLHLCDIGNQRLDRYGRDGRFLGTVREGLFSDLVFDQARGRLYLADVQRARIMILDLAAAGRELGEIRLPPFATETVFGLQLDPPDRLLVLTEARLFEVDLGAGEGVARPLTARHRLAFFRGFSILPDGDLLVSNVTALKLPTLVRYRRDGTLVREAPLLLKGRFATTIGSFLVRGEVHATCMSAGRVAVLDLTGRREPGQ
jgi:hypothetical protein